MKEGQGSQVQAKPGSKLNTEIEDKLLPEGAEKSTETVTLVDTG